MKVVLRVVGIVVGQLALLGLRLLLVIPGAILLILMVLPGVGPVVQELVVGFADWCTEDVPRWWRGVVRQAKGLPKEAP